MAQQAQDDHYGDDRALALAYADVVAAEVADLLAAGADVVRLDEPWLQARPEVAERYGVEVLQRALTGAAGTVHVHLCSGYAAMVAERPEGCSVLPELADVPADAISVETVGAALAGDMRATGAHPAPRRRGVPVRAQPDVPGGAGDRARAGPAVRELGDAAARGPRAARGGVIRAGRPGADAGVGVRGRVPGAPAQRPRVGPAFAAVARTHVGPGHRTGPYVVGLRGVEAAGIEPASCDARPGLLRAQSALSLLDPTDLTNKSV
jgi:hypothetical protein